jgi:Tol biopolymer transport system component
VVLSYDPLEIIFQRGGWGDWKLIRLGGDGVEHVELEDAEEPSISADGRWLAFVRRPAYAKAQAEYDWDVVPEIWLADRECHCLWHVEHSIAGGEFPTLSPDGSRLAWIEFNDGRVQTVVRSVEEITAAQSSASY